MNTNMTGIEEAFEEDASANMTGQGSALEEQQDPDIRKSKTKPIGELIDMFEKPDPNLGIQEDEE